MQAKNRHRQTAAKHLAPRHMYLKFLKITAVQINTPFLGSRWNTSWRSSFS